MKAVRFTGKGGPEVVELAEVEAPQALARRGAGAGQGRRHEPGRPAAAAGPLPAAARLPRGHPRAGAGRRDRRAGRGGDRLEGGRPGHGHRRRRGPGRAGGGARADAAARARGAVARRRRRPPRGRHDRPRRPLHHRRAAPRRHRAHPRRRLGGGHRGAADRPGGGRAHGRHQPDRRQAREGPGARPRPRHPGRQGGAEVRRRGEAADRPARRRRHPRLRGRAPTPRRTSPAWRRAAGSWSSAPWAAPRPSSTSAC